MEAGTAVEAATAAEDIAEALRGRGVTIDVRAGDEADPLAGVVRLAASG